MPMYNITVSHTITRTFVMRVKANHFDQATKKCKQIAASGGVDLSKIDPDIVYTTYGGTREFGAAKKGDKDSHTKPTGKQLITNIVQSILGAKESQETIQTAKEKYPDYATEEILEAQQYIMASLFGSTHLYNYYCDLYGISSEYLIRKVMPAFNDALYELLIKA